MSDAWECGGCGQMTTVAHWAEGADGKMHHVPLLTELADDPDANWTWMDERQADAVAASLPPGDDEFPPEVDYPDGHSPFCTQDCRHPCHTPYDEWKARQRTAAFDRAAGQALDQATDTSSSWGVKET